MIGTHYAKHPANRDSLSQNQHQDSSSSARVPRYIKSSTLKTLVRAPLLLVKSCSPSAKSIPPSHHTIVQQAHALKCVNYCPIPKTAMVGIAGKSKACIDCRRRRVKVRKILAASSPMQRRLYTDNHSATLLSPCVSDVKRLAYNVKGTQRRSFGSTAPMSSPKSLPSLSYPP